MQPNTITAADIRALLDQAEVLKSLTLAMRKEIRTPTWREVVDADIAADQIRDRLLRAALADVRVLEDVG